jgi:hypothetical protein
MPTSTKKDTERPKPSDAWRAAVMADIRQNFNAQCKEEGKLKRFIFRFTAAASILITCLAGDLLLSTNFENKENQESSHDTVADRYQVYSLYSLYEISQEEQ